MQIISEEGPLSSSGKDCLAKLHFTAYRGPPRSRGED